MDDYQFLWAPIVIFVAGFLLLRVSGKRSVSNMSNYDLFLVTAAGTGLGGFLTNYGSLAKTLLGVGILGLTYIVFSSSILNNKFRRFVLPKPALLIHHGDVQEAGLREARITVPELLGQLRMKGYTSVADVEFAILEAAGEISVIPKADKRPLQPSDLGLQVPKAEQPVPLCIDGSWLEDNLQRAGVTKGEVEQQLQEQGKTGKWTLVTIDSQGRLEADVQQEVGSSNASQLNKKDGKD